MEGDEEVDAGGQGAQGVAGGIDGQTQLQDVAVTLEIPEFPKAHGRGDGDEPQDDEDPVAYGCRYLEIRGDRHDGNVDQRIIQIGDAGQGCAKADEGELAFFIGQKLIIHMNMP